MSGIYYHKVNKDSGDLVLIKNPPYAWTDSSMYPVSELEEFNNITGNTFVITPQSGDLFLFPSHLPHQSFANNSDCDRICVSFNYTLHGSWGTSTQYISIWIIFNMEVVWSINIMVAILVLAVTSVIYYIMRYDLYNPND